MNYNNIPDCMAVFWSQVQDKNQKETFEYIQENLEDFLFGEKRAGHINAYDWDYEYVNDDIYVVSIAIIFNSNKLYHYNEVFEFGF